MSTRPEGLSTTTDSESDESPKRGTRLLNAISTQLANPAPPEYIGTGRERSDGEWRPAERRWCDFEEFRERGLSDPDRPGRQRWTWKEIWLPSFSDGPRPRAAPERDACADWWLEFILTKVGSGPYLRDGERFDNQSLHLSFPGFRWFFTEPNAEVVLMYRRKFSSAGSIEASRSVRRATHYHTLPDLDGRLRGARSGRGVCIVWLPNLSNPVGRDGG